MKCFLFQLKRFMIKLIPFLLLISININYQTQLAILPSQPSLHHILTKKQIEHTHYYQHRVNWLYLVLVLVCAKRSFFISFVVIVLLLVILFFFLFLQTQYFISSYQSIDLLFRMYLCFCCFVCLHRNMSWWCSFCAIPLACCRCSVLVCSMDWLILAKIVPYRLQKNMIDRYKSCFDSLKL